MRRIYNCREVQALRKKFADLEIYCEQMERESEVGRKISLYRPALTDALSYVMQLCISQPLEKNRKCARTSCSQSSKSQVPQTGSLSLSMDHLTRGCYLEGRKRLRFVRSVKDKLNSEMRNVKLLARLMFNLLVSIISKCF